MKEDREINIIAIIYDCLLHWRLAIVLLVVGALLGGVFGYVKSYRDSQAAIEESQKINDGESGALSESTELTQVEIATVKTSIDLYKYLEQMDDYREVISTNKLDCSNLPTSELIYSVNSTDYSSAVAIANKYTTLIKSGDMTDYLQNNSDIDTRYVQELISASVQDGYNDNVGEDTNSSCYFKVVMYGNNKEFCEEVSKTVKAYIDSNQSVISDSSSDYTVKCIADTFAYTSDYTLLTKIKTSNDAYNSALATLNKNVDGFSDKAKAYYELGIKGEEQVAIDNAEEVSTSQPVSVDVPKPQGSISKKFILLGAVALVCVYWGLLVLFKYFFNAKLKADDSVGELYKVTELGIINRKEDRKKFLGFVDKLIIKLRDRNKRKFSLEESIDLAASSIAIAANKEDLNEIITIGCNITRVNDTNSKLYAKLNERNINVTELDNVLYNADNKSKLPGQKGAVIIEQIGGTIYEEIEKEIQLLKSQDIKILGIVVVD